MTSNHFDNLQMHINNCMTVFPQEFDTHVRFMYLFLLHHASIDNEFVWNDSYFQAVLRFSDHKMEKCKKLLTMFGFMEEKKSVYSRKDKRYKTYYAMHYLRK